MEQVLEWWGQSSDQTKTLIGNAGFVIGNLIVAAAIKQRVRQRLGAWGIDLILLIPGLEKSLAEKHGWLSTLLSWLVAISYCLIVFDYFFADFLLFQQARYRDLFVRGWILLGGYCGALVLIRLFAQALIKVAGHAQVRKLIQHRLAVPGEPAHSRHDGPDFTATLADCLGIVIYTTLALSLGILLLADMLDLRNLGQVAAGLLSGLGRFAIAVAMIGIGIGGFRYAHKMETDLAEKPAFYLPLLVFAGSILLGIAVLTGDSGGLFSPWSLLLLLALAAFIFLGPLRASIPDFLAGLYLRACGYREAKPGTCFEGYRLSTVGWATSHLDNDRGEARVVRNREILEAGFQ